MNFNADDLLTPKGRLALAAEAERAAAQGFDGEVLQTSTLFLGERGNFTDVLRILDVARREGMPPKFGHVSIGDAHHTPDRDGQEDWVPTVSFWSENALDVVEHMARSHIRSHIELAAAIPTRVKAALVELAARAPELHSVLETAAMRFPDRLLDEAIQDRTQRARLADMLHSVADRQEAQLRDVLSERVHTSAAKWRPDENLQALPTVKSRESERLAIPSELTEDVTRAKLALKVLNWEAIMLRTPAGRAEELRNRQLADEALAKVAGKDPLLAALLHYGAVPEGNRSNWTAHNDAIVFSAEKWREYSGAISNLAMGIRSPEPKLRVEQFTASPIAKDNAIQLLSIYAWSQKLPATEAARNEFVATLEVAERLRGQEPLVQSAEEAKAFEFVKKCTDLRRSWRDTAFDPEHQRTFVDAAVKDVKEMGGRDLSGIPLRVATEDFIIGKGSLGAVFLKARTHLHSLTNSLDQQRYRARDVDAGLSR